MGEVVRFLVEESKKRDPEKRGINFLINQDITAAAQAARGTTLGPGGQLAPATAAEPEDLTAFPIKINPALTNIRLADMLDAVVKGAGRPIKYSLSRSMLSCSQPRAARSLLRSMFGPSRSVRTPSFEGCAYRGPVGTNGSGAVLQALLDHLSKAGVDLDPYRNPGKAIF